MNQRDPFENWPEGYAEKVVEAQTLTHVTVDGETYPRIAYGPDTPEIPIHRLLPRCRGCNVGIGQLHVIPCFGEVCAVCGRQAFGCPCLSFSEVEVSQ